ncbi:MAG: response regulator [Alphaproteobacteria bacterium]|nr:response regulator [Alphaproteobacteria bacterium]
MAGRILIAEDEPVIAESLTYLLERQGYWVEVAPDGRIAMEKLRGGRHELVVLDAMMQHFSGFDILKMVRSDSSLAQPKILMLTARGQKADRDLAFQLGVDEFITKPFANSDLLEAVSRLLDGAEDVLDS